MHTLSTRVLSAFTLERGQEYGPALAVRSGLLGDRALLEHAGPPEAHRLPRQFAGDGGVSFASVSEDRVASRVEDADGIWERNERIRAAELRVDRDRPMGELLEEGVQLSRFASELAAAARSEP
jgi:hypothetical protein